MLRAFKTRSLMLIYGIQFLTVLAGQLANAVLVLFALELDATLVEVASISLIAGLLNALLHIPFGILGDRYGRKLQILYPAIAHTLANLARSTATEPVHLILASLFGGTGVATPGFVAIIGDVTEPSERGDAYGAFYVCNSAGILIGPFLAGLLLLLAPIRVIYGIVTGLHVITVLLVLGLPVPKGEPSPGYLQNVTTVLKKKNMLIAILMRLAQGFFDAVRKTYIPIVASTHLHIPNALIASLGTPQGVSTFLVRLGLGTILRKLTAKRLILLTFATAVAIGLLLPFASTFTHLVILAVCAGIAHGANNPTSALLVADVSTSAERGFANAALYLASSAGALAPMTVITAATVWGLTSVFPLAAILPAATVVVVTKWMEHLSTERRQREEESTQPELRSNQSSAKS
jgi:MFS family permease